MAGSIECGGRARGARAPVVWALGLVAVASLAAHLIQAPVAGVGQAAVDDPCLLIGTTIGLTECRWTPQATGSGKVVVCPEWTAITSAHDVVLVISLHGPGDANGTYDGVLPQGLTWGAPLDSVWATLGRPVRVTDIYGTPTLVYMYDGQRYGSLELRFDADDRLSGINASMFR